MALWLVFGIFCLALLARAFHGELSGPPFPIHTPLNVESFVAVSFLLLLTLRAQSLAASPQAGMQPSFPPALAAALIAALAAAVFYRFLSAPLLFDDYGHIQLARQGGFARILSDFYRPRPDIFFRPLGFLSYELDLQWAHADPFRWHVTSLALHIVCCWLVYALARQLDFAAFASAVAAAVFALHGTRAEPVCWTDARFDLLATLFVLLALVCLERQARRTRGHAWLAGALAFLLLGLLSKESALAAPFLVLALCVWHTGAVRRRLLRAVPWLFALCAAEFVYRLHMIGGVGGYETAGHANVLAFNPLHSVKALFWREWALLFFPLNWSEQLPLWLCLALALYLGALAWLAWHGGVSRRRLASALLIVLAASLPVQHLLLLEPDLAGSRVLYLPVLGFALLCAAAAEAPGMAKRDRYPAVACLLLFQLCCLEWNAGIWTAVAREAAAACRAFGKQIAAGGSGQVEAEPVPFKLHGVFFLSDAFNDCVEMNSGVAGARIVMVGPHTPPGNLPRYRWNQRTRRFDRVGTTRGDR